MMTIVIITVRTLILVTIKVIILSPIMATITLIPLLKIITSIIKRRRDITKKYTIMMF